MNNALITIMCIFLLSVLAGCSKPFKSARIADDVTYSSRDYAAVPNDIYYAVRWALDQVGMPVATENLNDGIITSTWLPVTSDSHYIEVFGRPDYGVTNSYHQLEVRIVPGAGRAEVKVGSRVKGMVANLKSSGVMERKVLDKIGSHLRKGEPAVTNLGLDE